MPLFSTNMNKITTPTTTEERLRESFKTKFAGYINNYDESTNWEGVDEILEFFLQKRREEMAEKEEATIKEIAKTFEMITDAKEYIKRLKGQGEEIVGSSITSSHT